MYFNKLMKLINNYISKNILHSIIAIVAILSVIILLTQSLKYVDLIVSHGVSITDFFCVTILLLPSLLFILLPIYLFIAIIYSLNKLNSQRELNILKGVGISNLSLSKPILKIALFITLLHYFLSLYWMPILNHQFKELTTGVKANYVTFFLQEKVFSHPTDYLTFYIKNKLTQNNFEEVFYQDNRNNAPITIIAKTGELLTKDGKVFLNLKHGNRQKLSNNNELSVLYFDTLLVQLDLHDNSNNDRDLSIQELSLSQLLFNKQKLDPTLKKRMISEASNRIIWPLYDIILTLIAIYALIQGEYNRSSKTKRIIVFSAIVGAIIIINTSLINLGSTHSIAIWISYIFTLSMLGTWSYLLFFRQDK